MFLNMTWVHVMFLNMTCHVNNHAIRGLGLSARLDGPARSRTSTPLGKILQEHVCFVTFVEACGLPEDFEYDIQVLHLCSVMCWTLISLPK